MKKLLTLLALMPLVSFGQDAMQEKKPYQPKNEIGISTGVALNLLDGPFSNRPGLRIPISYLHNLDRIQIGLACETGTDDNGYTYISPALIFNQRFPVGKSYTYFGAAAGYYYERFVSSGWNSGFDNHGYTLGLQAGYVWNFSKHFSFTSEIALRSSQVWFDNFYFVATGPIQMEQDGYYVHYVDKIFELYLPVTFGMRYRF